MTNRPEPPGPAVANYKRMLRGILNARPSGTRQRLAVALGKNRSFISQVSNPAYATPLPARHLEQIFRICHFSEREQRQFLAAYDRAHPNRRTVADPPPATRPYTIQLPDLGDEARNRRMNSLVEQFVRDLIAVAGETGPNPKEENQRS